MSWFGWMPFKTAAAPRPQPTLRLVDRIETFDLGEARTNKVYYITGVGLTVETNTGAATARFNDPTSQQFTLTAGDSIPHIEFSRIYLTNAAQAGDTLTIKTRTPSDRYFGPQMTKMLEYGIERGADNTVVSTANAAYTTIKTIYITNSSRNATVDEVAFEYRVSAASLGDMRIQIDIDGGGYNTVAEVNNFNNFVYEWYRIAIVTLYGDVLTVIVQARNNGAGPNTSNRGMQINGINIEEVYNF